MTNKKSTLILLISLVGLLVLAAAGYALLKDRVDSVNFSGTAASASTGSTAADDAANERVEAPDFTVYTFDGDAVKLSDFSGKPIVINFWASWCGPCKSEMPDFQKVYEAYGDQVDFLMVNMTYGDETSAVAKAFVDEHGYTFPVYCDTTLEAASLYGANSIPTTFILDKEGRVYGYAKSVLNEETLVNVLEMLLNE